MQARVMHICVSKLVIIGSNNGLLPGRLQAIIWTNAGILLIGTLGTNFSEVLSKIHIFSFKKMHLKMLSAKWLPFCLSLNVLRHWGWNNKANLMDLIARESCSNQIQIHAIIDFLAFVTLKFDRWPLKTIENLFHIPKTYVFIWQPSLNLPSSL